MNLKNNQKLIDLLNKLNIKVEYLDDYRDLGLLLMCDFNEKDVNFLLKTLKLAGIKIPLKAIETEINKNWSPMFLYDELYKEYSYYLRKNTVNCTNSKS